MSKPTDKEIRRMARRLCKAHDRHLHGTNEHGALLAYDCATFAVPYWNALALIAHLYALPPQTEPDTSPTIGEEGAAVTGLDDRNGDREPQSRSSMAVTRSSQPRTDCAAPSPPAPIEPGEREWMLDVRPQLAHPSKGPEPSLRELVRRYYGEHFANTRANELCAQYLAALTPPTEPVVDAGEKGK